MADLGPSLFWDIFKHARSWLANLSRASDERKRQSKTALRGIITVSRKTAVYMRQMKELGVRDHKTEGRLAVKWTELGFALEDLGIGKLAKRCEIAGSHWANPDQYDEDFLKKADVSLERMESLAREILRGIDRK